MRDSLATVTGCVTDADVRSFPVSYAALLLKQGTQERYGMADKNGYFKLSGVRPGPTLVRVVLQGYDPYEDSLDLGPGMNMVLVRMKKTENRLREAVIRAETGLVSRRGDTLVFNPAAVKVRAGDDARAILEQLPGVTVTQNGIKVYGESVVRTYVNGLLVFGDGVTTALDMVPASEVSEVQVYDELSERDRYLGLESGRREKVVNLKTKHPIFSAASLEVNAMGGVDGNRNEVGKIQPRYEGRLTGAFYSEMLLAEAGADMTNLLGSLNKGTLSYVPTQFRGGTYNEDAHAFLQLEKYWKHRQYGNHIFAYYSYQDHYGRDALRARTRYLETSSGPSRIQSDTSRNYRTSDHHSFSLNGIFPRSGIGAIYTAAGINWLRNAGEGLNASCLEGPVESQVRRLTREKDRLTNVNANGEWRYERNPKWMPSLSAMYSMKRGEGNGLDVDTLSSSFLRRELSFSNLSTETYTSLEAKLAGIPFNEAGRTFRWSAGYAFNRKFSSKKKTVWDAFDRAEPELNTAQTFDYSWNLHIHKLTALLHYSVGRRDLQVSVDGALKTQRDEERFPAGIPLTEKDFWSICPQLSYKSPKWDVSVKTSTEVPSLEQLRPWLDDRNPLSLRGGNPGLRQSWVVNACAGWHTDPTARGNVWLVRCELSPVIHPVTMRTRYFSTDTVLPEYGDYLAKAGSMLQDYRQSSSSFRALARGEWNGRIPQWESQVKAGVDYRYAVMPQYAGASLLRRCDHSPGADLYWVFDYNWFRLRVMANVRYVRTENNQGSVVVDALNYGCQIHPRIYLGQRKYVFGLDYDANGDHFFSGLSRDRREQILDAFFNYTVRTSRQHLMVGLRCCNLLAQDSVYHRSVRADAVAETWQPIMGRMFLVNLSLRLRTNRHTVLMDGSH